MLFHAISRESGRAESVLACRLGCCVMPVGVMWVSCGCHVGVTGRVGVTWMSCGQKYADDWVFTWVSVQIAIFSRVFPAVTSMNDIRVTIKTN